MGVRFLVLLSLWVCSSTVLCLAGVGEFAVDGWYNISFRGLCGDYVIVFVVIVVL